MLERFKSNRNDSSGADLRAVEFKKAIWLYEMRKQALTFPETRTKRAEKIRRIKWRMIFESNFSLKEENWEGNGNTERSVFFSSKQTKKLIQYKGIKKIC